ncbi:Superoxide dismutase [Fe] [Candidatus Fokinia solitaria]|uniref:Superoxide dismutase n=1 Tax=Candidatus Fokinia solitaria TaxID=1802984 RepID=A0A2U8BRZ4_9RICK|nr:superoxide dismutase [Candidatus Fokinia solitaria]AWD33073.1 Superoxide dismutase [Fe] [Candidatus Fokinia solitaria]
MKRYSLQLLPYLYNALEPSISKSTLEFHYDKHHRGYLDNINKIAEEYNLEHEGGIESLFVHADSKLKGGTKDPALWNSVFNNAGQVLNHDFFWNSICAREDSISSAENIDNKLVTAIETAFGSIDQFKQDFVKVGVSQFGSGWIWLVWLPRERKLQIVKTANANSPLLDGMVPLMVCDVWEHAYYLDYQNRRADFLKKVVENHLNWKFVSSRFNSL